MLPVEACWPELAKKIIDHDVILSAPPGAGKSTFLPLKLLQLPCFSDKKIIMLQPRQIAVRSIAQYLAEQINEDVGQTIGYRMRGERRVSANTRLEIVTEGLLTRTLQNDPELNGVGLVIFDEFHERNLHADFALALCLDAQAGLREDLRVLVMSATLDPQLLSKTLPDAKQVHSQGRSFPVDLLYRPALNRQKLETHVFQVIQEALEQHNGDMLVFLPGARQIQLVAAQCSQAFSADIKVFPLYGMLDKKQQQQAVQPSVQGQRKIVLATNIAETSLTIDGITIVIDSGKENVSSFNLTKGISQLSTTQISKASATQRAGRAGRLSAGHCYRLWSNETQQRLIEQRPAQIHESDLSQFYLESLIWGSEFHELQLPEQPSEAQISHAKNLLHWLGIIDAAGKVTALGHQCNQFGCHPRFAKVLAKSELLGDSASQLACLLVAVLEGRPIAELREEPSVEMHLNVVLSQPKHPLWFEAKRWAKRLSITLKAEQINRSMSHLPSLLAWCFPEFLGKLRASGGYQLFSGGGADFYSPEPFHQLGSPTWLLIGRLNFNPHGDAIINLALPVDRTFVDEQFSAFFQREQHCLWSTQHKRVVARELTKVGEIVIEERQISEMDPALSMAAVLGFVRKSGLNCLQWNDSIVQLLGRLKLAHRVLAGDWPDFTEQTLLDTLDDWLIPYLDDVTSEKSLRALNWQQILLDRLDWNQQKVLQQELPTHLKVASGQDCKLTYLDDGTVELQVKMQQVYGWQQSPRIANGSIAVVLSLLSPAGRPLQKTADLAGFWQGSYKEVQKEMKGRYPKHFWPDDPANAKATSKTKKHM
ncbi:MAG: ATP-dependent helicase HrpB [Aliiglaciecola sp.]